MVDYSTFAQINFLSSIHWLESDIVYSDLVDLLNPVTECASGFCDLPELPESKSEIHLVNLSSIVKLDYSHKHPIYNFA